MVGAATIKQYKAYDKFLEMFLTINIFFALKQIQEIVISQDIVTICSRIYKRL